MSSGCPSARYFLFLNNIVSSWLQTYSKPASTSLCAYYRISPMASYHLRARVFGCGQPSLRSRDTSTLFSHSFRAELCLGVRDLFQSRDFREFREASNRSKRQIRASQRDSGRDFRVRISEMQRALQSELERRDSVSNGSKELGTCVAGRAEGAPEAACKLSRVWTDGSHGSNNAFREVRKSLQRQT